MRNRAEAVKAALATHTNEVGFCQGQVTIWYDTNPVGDFDGNGRANAVDGWESEPAQFKHTDRKPPFGVPVAYVGGSHGDGHRAISLGDGTIRSTDAGGPGIVATVPLDWPEKTWGLKYVGWSESMNGTLIPHAHPHPAPAPMPAPTPPPAPTPAPTPTRGGRVDAAIKKLRRADKKAKPGPRKTLIEKALAALLKIKPKVPKS
jgi:hypothetical protein